MDITNRQVNDGFEAGSVALMPRPAERRIVEMSEEGRATALAALVEAAPEEPLAEVAYWTEVLRLAEARLLAAGGRARRDGYTWAAIGWAWGDRPNQAAARKFLPVTREDAQP